MLKVRPSVGFEYVLKWGRWWRVRAMADREVAKTIGRAVLRCPWVIKPPASPSHLVPPLFLALAKHKLDGGFIHEELSHDRYRVTIVVDARREKPKH